MSQHYHSLESEKYFTAALLSDQKRTQRRTRSVFGKYIANASIIILACLAAYIAIKTMPAWLPHAEALFHQLTNYRYV
ncbi:MAG: hypothetical protein AAGA30_21705 [Planctomycetota bacterium]